jgi:hypothetical protein
LGFVNVGLGRCGRAVPEWIPRFAQHFSFTDRSLVSKLFFHHQWSDLLVLFLGARDIFVFCSSHSSTERFCS